MEISLFICVSVLVLNRTKTDELKIFADNWKYFRNICKSRGAISAEFAINSDHCSHVCLVQDFSA